MSWLGLYVRLKATLKNLRLKASIKDSKKFQQKILENILHKNASSQFGKEHHFDSIESIQDFQKSVPIRDYEGHRPYINKLIDGETSVLTVDSPMMFNVTSGTTSEPKLIPLTKAMERKNSAIMKLWLAAAAKDHPQAFRGYFLGLVSPEVESFVGDIPLGNISGRIYKRIPKMVRHHYAVPYDVFEVANYDQRYYLVLRFAVEKNITFTATPNPSAYLRLADCLQKKSELLIKSIREGTLGIKLASNEQHIQLALEKRLRPNPRRARSLEKILHQYDRLYPRDVWPQLRFLGCWTGGSVGILASKIRDFYGEALQIRDLGYLASEGRMSLPLRDGTPSGLLTLSTNFYEFVPEELDPLTNPTTLLAHELELGKTYYVILTNSGGLYRYDINDIVEVTGFTGTCPEIAFLRKGRDVVSITGEKLHVNHCIAALTHVLDPKDFNQFRMWPDLELSRYEIALELSSEKNEEFRMRAKCINFLQDFDLQLQKQNAEYKSKRESSRLNAPVLHVMRKGWFEAERRFAFLSGKKDIQFKWTHLTREAQPRDKDYILESYKMGDE